MERKVSSFYANVPILNPLKTLKNQRFSGVFRGYKVGTLTRYSTSKFEWTLDDTRKEKIISNSNRATNFFWEVSALLDVRHCPKLQSLQYSAAIAITGGIRGTSSDKLFQELDLETLKSRHWLRKLCLFYKLIKEQSPAYLFQLYSTK